MTTRKGEIYNAQSREIILSVLRFFKSEADTEELKIPMKSFLKRAAAATGVNERTIQRLSKTPETKATSSSATASVIQRKNAVVIDDFDKCVIRRKLQEFYTLKKQLPTIKKLLEVLKRDINFNGSRETVRKVVKELGFRWKRCQQDRKALIEKENIVNQRAQFLRRIKHFR